MTVLKRRTRLVGGRKTATVGVRCTAAELEDLRSRAGREGLSVPAYLMAAATGRRVISGRELERPAPVGGAAVSSAEELRTVAGELMAVRRIVSGVATNINQLAKVGNATGQVPAETGPALEAADRVLARVEVVVQAIKAAVR